MGEYFKPLQRKIGTVALFLTCLLVAGWTRSSFHSECVIISIGKHTEINFGSTSQMLGMAIHNDQTSTSNFAFWSDDEPDAIAEIVGTLNLGEMDWFVQFGRFQAGQSTSNFPPYRVSFVILPYWSIVIPLTLLSAWLLLSKPGVKPSVASQDAQQ